MCFFNLGSCRLIARVCSGAAEVIKEGYDYPLDYLPEGSFFGEMAFFGLTVKRGAAVRIQPSTSHPSIRCDLPRRITSRRSGKL